MKSDQDQSKIAEVLKKLRASYLGTESKSDSQEKSNSQALDDELESKLRSALDSASEQPTKKTRRQSRGAEKKPRSTKKEPVTFEATTVSETVETPSVIEDLTSVEEAPMQETTVTEPDVKAPSIPVMETVKEAPAPIGASAQAIPTAVMIEDAPVAEATEDGETSSFVSLADEVITESAAAALSEDPMQEQPTEFAQTVEEIILQEPISAPEESVSEAPKVSDSIVIQPPTYKASQRVIVIPPRVDTPEVAPQEEEMPYSSEPIRIGRRSDETAASDAEPIPSPEAEESLSALAEEPTASINESVHADTSPMDTQAELASSEQSVKEELPPKKPLSLREEILARFNLNEDDINMIFELGYENELGKLIGYENLKKLRSEHLRLKSKSYRRHYRVAFGYRGEECSGPADRSKLLAAYAYDGRHLLLRTVLTTILTLFALFVDVPSLIGPGLADVTAQFPLLLPIIGMILMLTSAALSYRQLFSGFRQFFKFFPTPYSVCSILLPIVFVYDVATLFASSATLPANFLMSFAILTMTGCDVLRFCGERRVLKVLTSNDEKTILESTPARKRKLRQGDKTIKIINDDTGEALYRVRHAREAVGFFRRFNDMSSSRVPFGISLLLMFSISLFFGFADAVITQSFFTAASAFMTSLMICAPVSLIFSYFYPLFHANLLLAKHHCALVGEEAVCEYNKAKVVIFNDTELFIAQKKAQIQVCEGDDFKDDLELTSLLLSKLGGTLGQLADSVVDYPRTTPVSILRIADNGVEAVVNGNRRILAGSEDFLQKNKISVPTESTDKALRRTAHTALMYIAIDGIVKSSYEIEYALDPDFERTVANLVNHGTAVGVRTYDPNLNDAFLSTLRQDIANPIRIIKPGRYEAERPLDLVDTGCVAVGGASDVASALCAADHIGSLHQFSRRMQWISCIVGSIGAVLLTIFDHSHLLSVLPIAMYQGFWMLVTLVATASELNRSTLRLKK